MGKYKDNNVTGGYVDFIEGTAIIKASLPTKNRACRYCRWCKHDYGLDREICLLTGEYLLDFKRSIGVDCPVEWDKLEELPDILF